MSIPVFADIETSINDDAGFPVAICWSLENGQMKSVLVIPEDDWLEREDNLDPHINLQELYNHGVPVLDIIREINRDLDGKTVYMPGHYYESQCIEMLFNAYDIEPSFEINPLADFLSIDPEEVPYRINQTKQDYALESPHDSEANVLAMLHLARELDLI